MYENSFIFLFLEMAIFLAVVFMHIARKNYTLIFAYVFQSIAVALMLLFVGFNANSISLIALSVLTFLIKVTGAPKFFSKLIGKEPLSVATTSYLSLPVTLAIILGLTVFAKSFIFAPLLSIFPSTSQAIAFAISGIFSSLFLAINRRGVFPQLVGILSFENEMVAFGVLAGVEQAPAIEIGVLFDILLWIIASSILITFVLSHFGSLNTTEMNKLKD